MIYMCMYVLVIYNLFFCLLEGMEFSRVECLLSYVLFVYADIVTCLLQEMPSVRIYFFHFGKTQLSVRSDLQGMVDF